MSEPEPPAPPPKAKPNILLIVLPVLNLAGTGFVAFKALKPPVAVAAPHVEEPKAPPAPVTAALDPFVINLNEPGSSRYLKTSFELEVESDKVAEQLTREKRAVRDELLRYLSGLTVADTLGEKSKTKIQEQALARLEKLLGAGKVRRIFFTDFVVQ